jgi:hypothetical protein
MTHKDIEWPMGYINDCDDKTGIASPLWSGMKETGTMANITGLCGDQIHRRVEGKPNPETTIVPHGRFDGVVPAGKWSQQNIWVCCRTWFKIFLKEH